MKSCCEDAFNDKPDWEDESEKDAPKGLAALKKKWKVNSIGQVILILCTFAFGGTLCSIAGKQIMPYIGPNHKGGLWILIYILLVTILWPLCVLLVSIPLGQFTFFRNYLKRIGARLSGKNKNS